MDSEDETDEAEPSPPKPKRKKQRTAAPEPEERLEPSGERRWTSAQVLMILAIGLGVGAFGGYQLRGGGRGVDATKANEAMSTEPAPEQLGPLAQPNAPAAGADKFGRSPGDEHFGHDHPPQGAAAPAGPVPSGTGVDSFGRAPGTEHYGHNHQ